MRSPVTLACATPVFLLALAAAAELYAQADAQPPARGGGAGRGGRGGPLSTEDQAMLAKLAELPPWRPGAGIGDYSTGPSYSPAPESLPRANVPKGKVETFQLPLAGSKFYPPSAGRDGQVNPAATREVVVYIPAQYVSGTPAPLLLTHDAMGAHDREPAPHLPTILDNLIADQRLPVMVAVMVMPSNQRSLEYDTVSGKYAEFIEAEVLPRWDPLESTCRHASLSIL